MLKAVNITKKFADNTVLDNFTHDFPEGKVTAVLGRSGCGKSTLLNILMGLLKPDSGEVVRGENMRIGAVFQEDRLCENLTVSANIRLVTGKRYTKAQIAAELAEVGLGDCADKPVRELSGGMKRRTALLRALLAEYDALFLDEPFKGLDEETKRAVIAYCRRKTAGKTVVFVTHDREECAALADEITELGAED
ncbi:MAG: ATP-binding cassette domain-containing protein [Lachnospiraceae bacterium]|nr:ATP-binding cassette domain-containing protein [Ruminococcus sp.]MCM1275347.1 ATP-binding cassette domain-containing protein [Lachnospiraceae bacterium]